MGLDMYLDKKTYVGNKYREPSKRVKVVLPQDQSGVHCPAGGIKEERISEITEQVAYWRKANAIHCWFVENVQDGNDDCRDYYVSREQLHELLETVNKVLAGCELVEGKITNGWTYLNGVRKPILEDGKYIKDPSVARELLPTSEGFFFGSTDYDRYYYQDLVYTKEVLEEVLADPDSDAFYYHSSW